jgi:hypothetical protein
MPFADDLLAAALREESPRWKFVPGTRYREMPRTFALQLLALATRSAPDRVVAGTSLATALVEKLHPLLGGLPPDAEGNTREPEAQGGIGGWTHAAAAWILVLAKETPAVWSRLPDGHKHRADLIMQAMAVAGHFTMSDANNYHVLLDGTSLHHKSWNINIAEGYVDVLAAAGRYFGAAELNAFFAGFDFDGFVAALEQAGLCNIVRCWTHRPFIRELLMRGGPHQVPGGIGPVAAGGVTGHGSGVRGGCFFQGHGLDETWALYRTQAARQFAKAVRTEILVQAGETTRLLQRASQATISPWEGAMGMCTEFEGTDWYGVRSSLTYAFEGVMINLGTAASLRVLGLWRDDASGRDIGERMAIGVSDLLFKAREGYRGWAHGQETIAGLAEVCARGSDYVLPMWSELFPPPPARD